MSPYIFYIEYFLKQFFFCLLLFTKHTALLCLGLKKNIFHILCELAEFKQSRLADMQVLTLETRCCTYTNVSNCYHGI